MWTLTIYSPLCHQAVTNLVGTFKSIAETEEGKQACIDALPDINAHEMASFRIALAIQTITGKPSSIVSKEHSLFKTAFQQSTSACDRRHCDFVDHDLLITSTLVKSVGMTFVHLAM